MLESSPDKSYIPAILQLAQTQTHLHYLHIIKLLRKLHIKALSFNIYFTKLNMKFPTHTRHSPIITAIIAKQAKQ